MTRKTRVLSVAGAAAALFAAVIAPQVASADTTPEAASAGAGATVSLETVNGSGCSSGTTRVVQSSDGGTITVLYSDYVVTAGEGAQVTEQRKNCLLSLDIDVPDGYTYAVTGLEYYGFADLEPGAQGLQRAEYYFQGESGQVVTHQFSGPYEGTLERRDSLPQTWAPCDSDRNLNVNTELRVTPGASTDKASVMAMAANQVPGTTLRLDWKAC